MLKKIRYLLEMVVVWVFLGIFKVIGVGLASKFGGFLARLVGSWHRVDGLACRNMAKALPKLTQGQVRFEVRKMWDNLGRIVGEYVHICALRPRKLVEKYVVLSPETVENINLLQKKEKKGGIIFSAHYGNWEIGPKTLIDQGFEVAVVYRPLNNPFVEEMTAKMRGVKMIAKGAKGGKEIIEAIKKGQYVVILADQKVSEGEFVKFFHEEALTATSLARIALKYGVDLIPARCIRRDGEVKFDVELEKPLEIGQNDDVLAVTRQINARLEDWIYQHPGQWFWVHDRWKR